MNKVILMGRLTKDPVLRQAGEVKIANYTLAVDRRSRKKGNQNADFISCAVFNNGAEFAEKYLKKGMRIAVTGYWQTGSYQSKNGTVYTNQCVVEDQEFAESKAASQAAAEAPQPETIQGSPEEMPIVQEPPSQAFMDVPESDISGLPFR